MASISAGLTSDIARFSVKARGMMQAVTKEALMEVGRRVVDRSPVGDPHTWHPPKWPKDYVPGLFKNNWQVGIDNIPFGQFNTPDATGSGSLERLSHLGRWQVGHIYYFVNNVKYALYLEKGWSYLQAPFGMVGLTVMEFQQIVDQAERKVALGRHWAFTG